MEDARMTQDQYGMPAVSIRFNNEGTKEFADLIKEELANSWPLCLDDKIVSAQLCRLILLAVNRKLRLVAVFDLTMKFFKKQRIWLWSCVLELATCTN
ncbi:MAG: hypothetical protein R3A45_09320 [Bdellovibrionota bacterium]